MLPLTSSFFEAQKVKSAWWNFAYRVGRIVGPGFPALIFKGLLTTGSAYS